MQKFSFSRIQINTVSYSFYAFVAFFRKTEAKNNSLLSINIFFKVNFRTK